MCGGRDWCLFVCMFLCKKEERSVYLWGEMWGVNGGRDVVYVCKECMYVKSMYAYVHVWRDWHVYGKTGLCLEESCVCMCL